MLTKKEIDQYFEEINLALSNKGIHGEIIMAGGAALTAIYGSREGTNDIDAIFEPSVEMREIISSIAIENDLEGDWLNDAAKGFFTPQMNLETYQDYSNLTVKSVDAEGLLAMKLTSARMNVLDDRDVTDSITLMKHLGITDVGQLYDIIQRNTHPDQQTPKSYYFTQFVFEQYSQE